jgi:hypothetical protein
VLLKKKKQVLYGIGYYVIVRRRDAEEPRTRRTNLERREEIPGKKDVVFREEDVARVFVLEYVVGDIIW